MNGINWKTIGDTTFEGIVDTLLSLEFGARGRPLDGRGGEGDIPGDFSVDDGKIIFEYKYFPDGFPAKGSQRPQIKRSFNRQKERNPDEWILVFPSKLTAWEQKFLDKLGEGTGITVNYRDRVWLNTELAERPNVANYFRFQSDNDYLAEKAQAYRDNPLIRTAQDLANRVRLDLAMAADADPHWGWNVTATQEGITQTLVAKHPNAQLLAPVTLSFEGAFEADSQLVRDLQQADAFGYCKPITIPGHLIRDLRVTGPPLVAWEGEVDRLVLLPLEPGEWFDVDLLLIGDSGDMLGLFPGRARGIGKASSGWSFEVAIGALLSLIFRAPYTSGDSGSANFTLADATGARPSDVDDATTFIYQLSQADQLRLRTVDGELAAMQTSGRFDANIQDYLDVREIARDLVQIEQETRHRFRYPATLDVEDRIMIRSLRLMLEGHCVAHPTWNQLKAELNGTVDASLEQFLTLEPHWILQTAEKAVMNILGQSIRLEHFSLAGIFSIDETDLSDLRDALAANSLKGKKLTLRGRTGDRVRMFLADRFDNKPIEITPWGLDGINQKGLTFDGHPVTEIPTEPST